MIKHKRKKTFIYLIPKKGGRQFEKCTALIIIEEFIKLNHIIIPIRKFYVINIILQLLTKRIDGIIVNSIKILWNNKLILKFKKITPIYWWYFDNPFLKKKNHIKSILLAKQVSIYFNKHFKSFNEYKKNGINPIWLDQGITSKYIFIKPKKYKYDIIFLGSLNAMHDDRTKILKKIDDNFNLTIFTPSIKKFKKLNFKHILPAISHDKISSIVAQTKITLVLNATITEDYCWSNRIHIMLGSGAFCLTDYIKGLENSYENEKDCIFINNLDQIDEKIKFWLDEKMTKKRNEIRLNGYNKAHEKHSYENRIKSMISHID